MTAPEKAPDVKTRSKTEEVKGLFLPYQVRRITAPWRYLFDEKARRIGLTYAYAYRYARKRAVTEGKTWYTANDAGTVLEFIDYVGYFGRLLNSAFEAFDDSLLVDGKEILTKVVRFKRGGQINKTKGLSFTREDFLAECRAGCKTEDQWKRQFLCEPPSDSTALLP